jgi:hypothetical protein
LLLGTPGEGVADDLLQDLKRGWQRLAQLDEQEGQYSVRRYDDDHSPGKLALARTSTIRRKPGFILHATPVPDGTGLCGFNPDYFFAIGENDGKGHYLSKAAKTGPGGENRLAFSTFRVGPATIEYFPLSGVEDQAGVDVVQCPSFAITADRPVAGGLREVAVHFERALPAPFNKTITRSWLLTLDPAKHYCVLKCRTDPADPEVPGYEFSREVSEVGGRLVCTRIDVRLPWLNEHIAVEFSDYDFSARFPEKECYLSHYGLPEPGAATALSKPVPLFVWLSLAAAVAFVGTIVFRFLAARRPADGMAPAAPGR